MTIVTIHEAKTTLSKLVARVEAGEETVIARGRTPVARLMPLETKKRKLKFGMLAGKYPDIPDSFFFDPLPDHELEAWDGLTDRCRSDESTS